MQVADYIFQYLKEYGIKHVFTIVGGGAMYLNNSLRKSGIKYICNHHEQACTMAAEGSARFNNQLAVVCATSGPGSLNCLTGVMGQWTDSIPVLYLSGQVESRTIKKGKLRQLGDQEVDIISIVKPITKYAYQIVSPKEIKSELRYAINEATRARKAPVWLDIPIDVQKAEL
jgi:acetolactate synthase-1/2/3 large subunit